MAEASLVNKSQWTGPVAIITDSRGFGLQDDLDCISKKENLDLNVQVFVWKGRGIVEATKQTTKQLIWMAPELVLIFAGICDVTQLDRVRWEISMADHNSEETADRFDGQMDIIRHYLSLNLTEKKWNLAFCELIGADMAKFNKMEVQHPQQEQMEKTIIEINSKIVAFNTSNNMPTPWTAKEVHHNKKSRSKVSRYNKLDTDGLHLSEGLRWKVATTLFKYITKSMVKPQ